MKRRMVLIAIQCLIFIAVYYLVSAVAYARNIHVPWMTTVLDRNIPFVPAFVWAYISTYLLDTIGLYLAVRHLKDEGFRKVLVACYINLILLSFCHLVMPQMAMKPAIEPVSVSNLVLVLIQRLTTRYNTFPSAHVSYSLITVWAAIMSYRKNRSVSCILIADALAVIASTLFVKEHTVIDVAGGIGIAIVSVLLSKAFTPKTMATN